MFTTELIEATFGLDTRYTEADVTRLAKALDAALWYAKSKSITIKLSDHFFDQIFMKRRPGETQLPKVTHDDIIETFGRILTRGITFFRDKPEGTNFIFFDPKTLLNIPLIKKSENRYIVPTIVKNNKYLGRGQKITL